MGSQRLIRTGAAEQMGPRDFIQLAGLGTAARAPATFDDIRSAIDDIVGHLWTPVTEVVAGCVEDLMRNGCLQVLADHRSGERLLAVTASGQQYLGLLLARPTECPLCPSGQVGLRLKIAFIDLLPEAERRHHLENIACLYERELVEWSRRCASCPRQGGLGRMWLDIESDRLHREIKLLRRMARGQAASGLM